jgi:hypothetical protein
VTRAKIKIDPFTFKNRQAPQVNGGNSRLKIDCSGQFFHWAFKAQFGDMHFDGFFSHFEDFTNKIIFFIKFLAHSHALGSLTGKKKSHFVHNKSSEFIFPRSLSVVRCKHLIK